MNAMNYKIKNIDLFMFYENLSNVVERPLPKGYTYKFYEKGNKVDWIEIQLSAKQIANYEEGNAIFERTFAPYEDELSQRMIFIKNEDGECMASATAFMTTDIPNIQGKVHWVAIKESYQSKGLSKPLLTHTLKTLHTLGYPSCMLHTQTLTWLAIKVYLDLGFLPYHMEERLEGWKIIKKLTHHAVLEKMDNL